VIARKFLRIGALYAPRLALAGFCMAATALADGSGASVMRVGPIFANEVEGSLVRAITGLSEMGLKRALVEIDKALDRNPNFRLGQLIKGDMLMARAGRPMAFAALAAAPASVAPLQDEARARLQRYVDAPPTDYMPAPVMQIADSQAHVLLVDTSRSRLFVFANELGRPRYVADFYISLGKNGVEKEREGDQKTPIGIYTITSSREKLPDFYGPGAFPIDYPNEWDRMHGRQGHGIWLHGTPSATYSRPPWATDGCVVLTNDDLARLAKFVDVSHTPVIIGRTLDWQDEHQWEAKRDSFLKSFGRWKADWESRDAESYFSHYAAAFRTESRDLASWKSAKRKANASKAWIKVGVGDLSLFAYPGAKDMMMVTFEQDYRSSNMSSRTVKRQYWVREGEDWRIIHEAVVS
jgi:murein L,D-transpeptidase YafK